MIRLVIFDLDGTLVNSIDDLADSVNEVLEKRGYKTYEVNKYYHFVGDGTLKLIERALHDYARDRETIKAVHEEFAVCYEKNCLNKTKPYRGITNLLEALKDKGIMTAVASNKTDIFTKEITKALFCDFEFSAVFGKLDGVPKKPDPTIIFNIMDKLNVNSEETLYVGDSDVDVYTARNSGLKMAGCIWGFRGREELERAGADYLVEKPQDIIKVIDKLNN